MPTQMELIEDGHIINSALVAPWTLEDLFAAWRQEEELRNGAPIRIHSILDVSRARPAPRGLVTHLRQSPSFAHSTKGIIIIVGASVFTRALMDIAMRITGHKDIKFMDSREEALTYLRAIIVKEKNEQTVSGGVPS